MYEKSCFMPFVSSNLYFYTKLSIWSPVGAELISCTENVSLSLLPPKLVILIFLQLVKMMYLCHFDYMKIIALTDIGGHIDFKE